MASRRSPSKTIGERSVRTVPCGRMRERALDVEMAHLRIVERVVEIVDRRMRHVGRGEAAQPFGARARREHRAQRGFQRLVIAHAVHARGEARVAAQAPARRALAAKPSQNLTGEDRWIAINPPSAQANANDCDTRPRSVVSGTTPVTK